MVKDLTCVEQGRGFKSFRVSVIMTTGRVVVVNHILLATMWHSVACWMLDKACIKNIKAMVRGFIWSGRDNEMALAKVAWICLMKAKNNGGIGLVDLIHQSKVLLGF